MTQAEISLIPRTVLFGNPLRTNPKISPDGERLSYVAPLDGVLNVYVRGLEDNDAHPVTNDKGRGIWEYFWSKDGHYILYLQDQDGNENWRMYAVNLESREIRDLTPFENVQVRLLETSKRFPDEILIEMNKRDPRVHDVYHLQISSGRLTLRQENPGDIAGWLVDIELKIRGELRALADGSFEILVRDNENGEWRKLLTWSPEDNLSSRTVCFSGDGEALYLVDPREANTGRLVRIDIRTGAIDVIAEDEIYDISDIIINPDNHEIQALSYLKDRRVWHVLDDSLRENFERMIKISDGDPFFIGRDNSKRKWMIGFESDTGPISYYLYDLDAGRETFLFDHRPELREYKLAPMEPISFKSRDGLTIHGYISYPQEREKRGLPLVLHVHGGPWHRDTWGYNPDVQWLVNRGYACLQVNFRGSTGYGKKFLNAGNREWGRKMHDDLVDAVNWAVEQGIADPKKMAIYGGSYGGYAALVGATFTPDLFRCAIDVVGPSSLTTLINSVPPYWSTLLAMFKTRIGNPDTEEEFLKSRSPLFKVNNIKIPILIGQGANDPRVKVTEAKQIVKAMEKKGIDYEYLEFPDEGHGFARPENRLKFYAVAEKFLAKHLGGRYENEKTTNEG